MICKSGQYLFMFLSQGNSELAACKDGLGQPKEFFTCFREKLFARATKILSFISPLVSVKVNIIAKLS